MLDRHKFQSIFSIVTLCCRLTSVQSQRINMNHLKARSGPDSSPFRGICSASISQYNLYWSSTWQCIKYLETSLCLLVCWHVVHPELQFWNFPFLLICSPANWTIQGRSPNRQCNVGAFWIGRLVFSAFQRNHELFTESVEGRGSLLFRNPHRAMQEYNFIANWANLVNLKAIHVPGHLGGGSVLRIWICTHFSLVSARRPTYTTATASHRWQQLQFHFKSWSS